MRCRHSTLWFLFFTLATYARAQTQINGLVYYEAEHFSASIPRSGQEWAFTNEVPRFSETGYMEAPNAGNPLSNINENVTTTSPELQYNVWFSTTGTHRVWARAYGLNGTEDSLHIGLDGTLNANGSNLNWNSYGSWTWTNGPASRTISVASTGLHTFNLWMREDGARVDRFLITTSVLFHPLGQAFHFPGANEPGIATMRLPFLPIPPGAPVTIYNGNQFQGGGGNPGNQLQTGSALFYKHAHSNAWNEQPLYFHSEVGNNKYFSNSIPAAALNPGDSIQYYLRIPYSDHLTTYLYGNDNQSLKSDVEDDARANPFSFSVQQPLLPSGPYLAITSAIPEGELEARLYTDSGHISLIGPDRAGVPAGLTNTVAPAQVRIDSEWHFVGTVLDAAPIGNGLALVQRLYDTSVVAHLTFASEGVLRYEVIDWGGLPVDHARLSLPSSAGERFYGLGEKFNAVDQSGRFTRIITDDPPGNKDDKSYKVVPWYISTRGGGFHLDSSAESTFDLRFSAADRVIVSNLFGSLKFNLVHGPSLTNVLVRYTAYTGRPEMAPPWAFAPWMSSDHWRDGGEVRYVISKLVERNVAGSAFVFDSPWETGYNDFTWNTQQFADGGTYESIFYPGFASIGDMMTFLRTNGYKAICWMTPFVNTVNVQDEPGITNGQTKTYAEGAANNYFVRASPGGPPLVVGWWKGQGSHVDFTNPDATSWLQNQLSNLVAESGGVIGGFKTDDGESGNPPGGYIPKSAVYFDGRTGEEMQNGYSAEYHKRVWQVLGTNGVLFARSGFTGSQTYPGYWSGDNEPNFGMSNGLATVIIAGLSAGFCGYSIWGHDIGGYQNSNFSSTPTNLFMRWTQFGAFSPLMQMHRQVGLNNQYPWSYGAAGLSNYVFYTRLHTALFPYIYTYARESNLSGLPIMRHPALLYPDDANTHNLRFTYLFGNELLVAPMTGNVQVTRGVYLPAGHWHDFWTNRSYAGNQTITWSNENQSLIPVLVRAGAIIPMLASNVMTLLDSSYTGNALLPVPDHALEFLVYPTTESSFTVYDGTFVEAASNETVITLGYQSAARPTRFKVLAKPPAGVERAGVRLARFTDQAEFAAAGLGWWYDADSSFVHVKFDHGGGATQVRMGPDSVGDGLSDSWRLHYFGTGITTNDQSCRSCDADGDGFTNEEEYFAGTDPTASNSVLRVADGFEVIPGGDTATVRWPSEPGIPYRVQYRDQMEEPGDWLNVPVLFTGDGSILSWVDDGTHTGTPPASAPGGRRFYRVLAQ
jgi:alpha-D-xyloside xylohydrolase